MWQYVTSPDGLRATIVDDQGYTIADLSVPANTTAAKAFPDTLRLMTAAPELLTALQECLAVMGPGTSWRIIKQARAAIERADSRLELLYVSDDSHGWIGVDYATLEKLGIASEITPYSYEGPDRAWLEEDRDAATLIRALAIAGIDYRLADERVDGTAWIRSLPPFGK